MCAFYGGLFSTTACSHSTLCSFFLAQRSSCSTQQSIYPHCVALFVVRSAVRIPNYNQCLSQTIRAPIPLNQPTPIPRCYHSHVFGLTQKPQAADCKLQEENLPS